MIGYVYKVTCLVNNKIYIGKHRKPEFDETYWGSGKAFLQALKKYGKENFKREIIDTAKTIEELLDKEEYWIQRLQARDSNIGYNILKRGALGNSSLIKITKDQETKFICIDQFAQYEQDGWAKIDYKETDKAYYQKHKQQIREQQRTYNQNNKEKIKQLQQAWEIKNKEQRKARHQEYYQQHKKQIAERQKIYREQHKTHIKELQKAWETEHPNRKRKKKAEIE